MTESEKNQIVQEITQNVLTALANNSIDWSTSKISFSDIDSINTATREKVLVPAIDTRNNQRVYGNLDLNTLLSAYGLKEAMKVVDTVEEAGSVVSGEIANAKNEAIAEIDSRTETEKAELSTHANAEKGTISSATSNAISSIQQARDSAKSEVSSTATSKKNELNSIVATGISKIEQTTTSTESGGSNVLTITQTNGTPTQFIVRNGSKGDKGDPPDISNIYTKSEVDNLIANAGGGGSSEVSSKLIAGSDNATGGGGYDTNSDADINAFIETGIVKWAKYRNISGLPNGDGLVQSIGWRSPVDGAGWGRQIAYDDESHNIYSRYMGNGSWSGWTKVLVAGDSAPASDVYAWAKASSKPTYTASEVGASKVSYLHNSTSIPSMSVGELKIVGYSSWGSGANFKLPSGGSYYIVGVEEYEDSTIEDWVGMGINGTYSGGNTISTGGYHPWILVYRIS